MYKLKLTMLERIMFPAFIPQKGNYLDNIVADDIDKKLKLTQIELDKYEVKAVGEGLNWNEAGVKASFEFELTEREYKMVKTALEVNEAASALPRSLNKLYEVICKPELPKDLKPTKK